MSFILKTFWLIYLQVRMEKNCKDNIKNHKNA